MSNPQTGIVIGANGYLGRHLVSILKGAGFDIIAYDIQEESESFGYGYNKLDILNQDELKNVNWNVNFVFVFAGITGTNSGFDIYDKFIKVNEIGLLNILNEISRSEFRPRIVYPSTRLIYKGSSHTLREDDMKEAKTIYAINKMACENILMVYWNSFNIPYTIYRICVPYGNEFGDDYSYGTIGLFISQAKTKGKIMLYGDGSLRRSFTHVEDICKQIQVSCQNNKSLNQVYNLIGEDFSLEEIAVMIAKKHEADIVFSEWPDRDLRIESGNTVFNSKKLEKDFNLELKNSFQNWLSRIS